MKQQNATYLDKIDSPEALKRLSVEELRGYCDELRHYIIEACSVNPGHLASSLGTVELAAALHYVYNTPKDKLVWDVGHQTYPHKIITVNWAVSAVFRAWPKVPTMPLAVDMLRSRYRLPSVWPKLPSCRVATRRLLP